MHVKTTSPDCSGIAQQLAVPISGRGRVLPVALLALAITACAPSEPTALDANGIRSTFVDRSFRYTGGPGGDLLSGTLTFRADGALDVITTGGQRDGGRWTIEGDRMCSLFLALRRPELRCFTIYANPNRRYSTSHGFTLRPV